MPAAARSRATWTWSSRSNVMELADAIDHVVLFSGDGDFRSLVEAVQRKGRKVSVVSTLSTQPPMIADELRRQADTFIDLVTLQAEIGRNPTERAESIARAGPNAARPSRRRSSRRKPDFRHGPIRGAARPDPIRRGIVRCARDWRRSGRTGVMPSRSGTTRRCRHSAPLDARLLIVGLAPGLRGANRTGRPFTGDYAGDLLYGTMIEVRLRQRVIRCAPR